MINSILTVNTGSATIKLSLFIYQHNNLAARYRAEANKLDPDLQLTICAVTEKTKEQKSFPENTQKEKFYAAAISLFLDWLETKQITIDLVSHRVVHGGTFFCAPIQINDQNLKLLETLNPLAPLHQPFNLQGIYQARERLPDCPHIACFDTAFHHTNPTINHFYAIPRSWETAGVRRYGFHGLSYAYIQLQLEKCIPEIAKKKVIIAHLGQGASLCALDQGCSILTSMGFTALDGLVMGTRSGTIDPGVLLYWMQEKKLTADEISNILYNQSGLLGLSGISADMRTVLATKTPEATLAIDIYVQRICHYIGQLAAELQGLDALIFTAGIGENAVSIRKAVCSKLQWLGVKLDDQANVSSHLQISDEKSAIALHVIPTDEEYMLAKYALAMETK